MTDEDTCPECPHSDGDHVLIGASDQAPPPYGIRLCPVPGCQCYATWALASVPYVPEPFTVDEIASLRARVQAANPVADC
jgi:hypothetical protein